MLGSLYDYPLPTESSEIEKPPKKNVSQFISVMSEFIMKE